MTSPTHSATSSRAPALTGSVVAVCSRAERSASMAKPRVEAIRLDVARGVVGDVHEGRGDRQVMLIAVETLDELRAAVGPFDCGAMGENLVLAGIDPASLTPGARLEFASGAAVEVTQARTPCVELEEVARGLLRAAVRRCGLFARVLYDGQIAEGDAVRLLASPSP